MDLGSFGQGAAAGAGKPDAGDGICGAGAGGGRQHALQRLERPGVPHGKGFDKLVSFLGS